MSQLILSKQEEYDLITTWQTNRDADAVTRLMAAHDGFCCKVAAGYVRKKHDIPLEDLAQQGRIGLFIAINKFDLKSGNKLLSYAGDFIRGEIQNHIDYLGYTVHHSVPTLRDLEKVNWLKEQFFCNAGRYPSINELSELSELKPKRLARLLSTTANSVSLDQPQITLNDKPMLDFLESDSIPQPQDAVETSDFMEKLYTAIDHLPAKEQDIIRLHFLSDQWDEATYEELGTQIGMSKANAHKTEKKAIKKLTALLIP